MTRRRTDPAQWITDACIPEPNSGCWLWDKHVHPVTGYGSISIDGRTKSAHRVAYAIFKGPIPAGLLVCHKCDVRSCVNPQHLFLGTYLDNNLDKIRKGRGLTSEQMSIAYKAAYASGRNIPQRGIKNPQAKLTDAEVLEIRASDRSQSALALRFGIDQSMISLIRTRKRWRHL